ncbi:MAG: DNA polymerase III subunit [Candidatus Anammoximicrobium sp.]|nr:DNA polymerase III subunit [Candidatus Anammoximicrobium sp.]
MTWQEIEGHDLLVDQFRQTLRRGRLASTFLFIGPAGIGKRTFALKLAQSLLCEVARAEDLQPCGHCPACQQVATGTHPDLLLVAKPEDRSFIPVELFIGDREHRMREGLCHDIALKPFRGGRKIAVIDDADFLNQEGANCLLKTLEEPPPKSLIILIGTSEQKQLPTIRSRSQIVRFRPLPQDTIERLLISQGLVPDPQTATRLAALSEGSVQRALDLADPQLDEFREGLLSHLSQPDANAIEFAKGVGPFVDQAGKEAPPRRARMIQLFGLAAEFYRQLMRALAGLPIEGDDVLVRAVRAGHAVWPGDEEAAAACLERCLEAQSQVLANANQATLIDCWVDDLATITRTGRPLAVG